LRAWYGKIDEAKAMQIMAQRESQHFTRLDELVPIFGQKFVEDNKNDKYF